MRVAVLEDDETQRTAVSHVLNGAGHTCKIFGSVKSLISSLRRESFDLLVLDWLLPDSSGLDVIDWVRQNLAESPPILLLTCRGSEADVVQGLNAGADDFIVKPCPPEVLLARIQALLRRGRTAAPTESVVSHGDYRFDRFAESVTVAGADVPLTAKEFQLALLFFTNIQRSLSRSYILESVWGRNPDLPTRTLDMHVSRVRSKLNLRPDNGYRLAPIYSFGYRLERLDDAADDEGES